MDRESIINKTRNRMLIDLKYLEKQILNSESNSMSMSVCNIVDAVTFFEGSYLQSLKNCAYSLFLLNLQKCDNDFSKYTNILSTNNKIKEFITYETPWESYSPSDNALDTAIFLNNKMYVKGGRLGFLDFSTVYFLDYILCSTNSDTYDIIHNQPTYENLDKWVNHHRLKDIMYEIASEFDSFSGRKMTGFTSNTPNINVTSLKLSHISKRNVKVILPNNLSYSKVVTKIINKQKRRICNLLKLFDKATVPIECADLHISKLEICFIKCLIEHCIENYSTGYYDDLDEHKEKLWEERECYCDGDELDGCECERNECVYVDSFLYCKKTFSPNNIKFFQLI